MTRPSNLALAVILSTLMWVGILSLTVTLWPASPPYGAAGPAAATLSRTVPLEAALDAVFANPQGYLIIRVAAAGGTPARWGLLSPTGGFVVWFHDPAQIETLERQLQAETRQKVFSAPKTGL